MRASVSPPTKAFVMSLHGELRNIIFDDSPLPVIQRNLAQLTGHTTQQTLVDLYNFLREVCSAAPLRNQVLYLNLKRDTCLGGAYT